MCIVLLTARVLTSPPLGLSCEMTSWSWNPSIRAQNEERLSGKFCDWIPQQASATLTGEEDPIILFERQCDQSRRLLNSSRIMRSSHKLPQANILRFHVSFEPADRLHRPRNCRSTCQAVLCLRVD